MGKKGKGVKKAAPLTPEELERLRAETDLLVHEWGATRSKVGFEVIMSVIEARRLDAVESSDDEPIASGGAKSIYYFQALELLRRINTHLKATRRATQFVPDEGEADAAELLDGPRSSPPQQLGDADGIRVDMDKSVVVTSVVKLGAKRPTEVLRACEAYTAAVQQCLEGVLQMFSADSAALCDETDLLPTLEALLEVLLEERSTRAKCRCREGPPGCSAAIGRLAPCQYQRQPRSE